MKSLKEHFEINIENLSDEKKADVLYYNIFLAIVSELKLDRYFVDSNNNKQDEDIQHLVGMSFRMTFEMRTIQDVVDLNNNKQDEHIQHLVGMSFRMTFENRTIQEVIKLRPPMDIWKKLKIYYLVREKENIPMMILIDELIEEFSANNLTYNEKIVSAFYKAFKNYIMSKTYSSDEIKNIDINVNWEKIDDLFSEGDVV